MQKQRRDKKLDFWWQRWTLWPNLNYSLSQNLSQPNPKIRTVYKPFIMWDSNSLVVYLHLIFCGHTWGHPYLLPNWLLLGLFNIILSGTSIQSISLPFFFSAEAWKLPKFSFFPMFMILEVLKWGFKPAVSDSRVQACHEINSFVDSFPKAMTQPHGILNIIFLPPV